MNKGCEEVPQIGDVVLIVGEERNIGKWMKGRVVRHVEGKDGVIRGTILLHKGNRIERPIQLLCPLENRSAVRETKEHNASTKDGTGELLVNRKKGQAAKDAVRKIRELLQQDNEY